ncbi:DcaP family trimeric outer membrane transporter [Alteromonas sp. ASW11-36]|uniref:DcaP family trimeric outer membrane transporter n=1 Tax=Alteromonas arenosi TaxID=3055817 RepID=A0ABT7T1N7_9ALTE|nr:DcaP family trimeric outer membrane transporter [Alteromonas sp. ASW11-36]MDM7862336.1 DcaP family trimeric outer membrane transporter [Alteromonas sp. ASW11-36]
MKAAIKKTASIVALTCAGLSGTATAANLAGTDVKFSGYIKLDAIVSNYSEGSLATGNLNRDFYVPALIPVNGLDEGAQMDIHARQSRFRFTTSTATEEGDTITGVLEFDMLATPNGNDRISSSWTPRIRHAFMKYKNWTIGQTWSTFMDVSALPETLDFIGVTDGTIFDRQALVRYTSGAWEFAAENPETTVTPFGGGGRIVADDNVTPDLVARYTHKADWGYLRVAGLLRQLAYDNGDNIDSTDTSIGISVTGKINLDNGDDLRFMLNTGQGLGRYIGLNTANGAVIDANGELQAIDSFGYAIAYRHVWNEKMRSNFTFSALDVDNDTALTGLGVTQKTYSARANLLYSPTKAITVGGEIAFANRETEGGLEGDMNRIQFSAKYAF